MKVHAVLALLCCIVAWCAAVRCGKAICPNGTPCVACDPKTSSARFGCGSCPAGTVDHTGGPCNFRCKSCVFCATPSNFNTLHCQALTGPYCPKGARLGDSYKFY